MTTLDWLKPRRTRFLWAAAATVLVVAFAISLQLYKRYERIVDRRLADGRWKGPSRVYARPVTVSPGLVLRPEHLIRILALLGYERRSIAAQPGEFVAGGASVTLFPRADPGGAGEPIAVRFEGGRVASLQGALTRRSYPSQDLGAPLLTFLLDESRERRHVVKYAEIPDHLVKAVLAIEDRRFFHHGGLDPMGIVRAAARNIESEAYSQGGSTITQQLARSSFLKPEKTLRRKLQEALLSFVLERRLSKEEILELYLNDVYFGQVASFNVQGVGQAARTFFGKEVRDLTLPESALLAGMIQSPNAYSPYRHADAAKVRRDQVLRALRDAELLHPETVDFALKQPLGVKAPTVDPGEAPHFVELVKQQLESRVDRRALGRRNLAVETTLDLPLQMLAEDVLDEGLAALEQSLTPPPATALQGSLVALDPRTGAVVALVGGRTRPESPYNRALYARRQPGSAFKPFVYLAAFERSFGGGGPTVTPATIFEDQPSTFAFRDETYAPRNNDGHYWGPVTARRALTLSLNVATMKVAERVGYDTVADMWSRRLGFGTLHGYPALALGALETTPLEMAAAYEVLATGGLKREPTTLVALADERGAAPLSAESRRVVHEASAFLVTNMLRSVINEGTAYSVRELGFMPDAAGKTGTTNNSRDAWFAGYTPDLLCVVWVGFDDNTSLQHAASEAALPIWVEFMKHALATTKPGRFAAPAQGIVYRNIDKDTGLLATPDCPRIINEAFIAGTEPKTACAAHRSLGASDPAPQASAP